MQSLKSLGLLLILHPFFRVDALECYSCLHSTPEDCFRPKLNGLSVMTCPSTFTHCIKIVGNSSDGVWMTRDCGPAEVCQAIEVVKDVTECHICDRKLCNSTSFADSCCFLLILALVAAQLRCFVK
ncbi:uncharacterized protein LOC132262297 [Phlebotomus argentipes]|uniref:uncharacterized protein LOC132262297 n=1 Tax=Phlebotomus argentipes TaxID=94469 RepID=UPI00289348C8|nr:uncharacterized protein LOC132262297 [Phlebotomus argentipes]